MHLLLKKRLHSNTPFSPGVFLVCSLIMICLDQASKSFFKTKFPFLTICNSALSWGIPTPFWLIFGFLMTFFLLSPFFIPKLWFYSPLGSIFLFSGALANFLDRFLNGCVIDFIHIPLSNFPLFNIADIFLTISFLLFLKNIASCRG